MARTYAYSADFDKEVESLFKDAKLLGEGHNGIVHGKRLDNYIEENGLSQQLIYNIYILIKEFKYLKFTKLDARCRDIYVNKDERVKVIDPKQCYKRKVDYPRHLMKGLDGKDILEEFLRGIYIIDRRKAEEWEKKIKLYYLNDY